MNKICFGKGCHYEKNEQWTTEMVRSVNWKNTFSKNKQKNIKKNDLKLYQHTWKKNNSLLINEWFSKTIAFNWFNNFPDIKFFFLIQGTIFERKITLNERNQIPSLTVYHQEDSNKHDSYNTTLIFFFLFDCKLRQSGNMTLCAQLKSF